MQADLRSITKPQLQLQKINFDRNTPREECKTLRVHVHTDVCNHLHIQFPVDWSILNRDSDTLIMLLSENM